MLLKLKPILLSTFIIITTVLHATTWDEPWQKEVIKQADYFVFAKIKSLDEKKSVTIEIIKSLGGLELKGEIKITDFYLLDICSNTDGHDPELNFKRIKESYFFIKKNQKGEYCIATPTAGFDYIKENKVYATYRHSYHQALVPIDIYEKTMIAIFNYYHKIPYDEKWIYEFVKEYLSHKPAGFKESEIETFFNQHVALETVYHLQLTDLYQYIIPFLNDTSNFHNQVSAARALVSYNTSESKRELLTVLRDTTRSHFVQVICINTLSEYKPKDIKNELIQIEKTASNEDTGFGGNLMDPRVCTHFPEVKDAINKLIKSL